MCHLTKIERHIRSGAMALLLSVPPEVMTFIIEAVDEDDLPNLRLTSREFCSIFTERFFRISFSVRSFVFPKHSLEDLIDLTNHPFAKHFRCINLGTHYIKQLSDLLEDCRTQAQSQTHSLATREHVRLISQALKNLKQRGIKVNLGLFDDVRVRQGTVSLRVKKRALRFREYYDNVPDLQFWDPKPGRALKALVAAAKDAEYSMPAVVLDLYQNRSFPSHGYDEHYTEDFDSALEDFLLVAPLDPQG